jgi:hypothetical protein
MKKITLVIFSAVVSVLGFVRADNTNPAATPPAAAPAVQAAPVTPAAIAVEKMAVGTAIDNREISGEGTAFDSSVTRLYAWSQMASDQVPTTIKHVWSADGKKETEVPLDIKYPRSRTWSSKSVWPGHWKVDVTNDQGMVLASKEFTVTKEAVPAPQAGTPPAKPTPPAQVGQ